MLSDFAKSRSSLLIVLSMAIAVSACGRRGGLEPPPAQTTGFEEPAGEAQAPQRKPNKPFILDPLL